MVCLFTFGAIPFSNGGWTVDLDAWCFIAVEAENYFLLLTSTEHPCCVDIPGQRRPRWCWWCRWTSVPLVKRAQKIEKWGIRELDGFGFLHTTTELGGSMASRTPHSVDVIFDIAAVELTWLYLRFNYCFDGSLNCQRTDTHQTFQEESKTTQWFLRTSQLPDQGAVKPGRQSTQFIICDVLHNTDRMQPRTWRRNLCCFEFKATWRY